MKPLDEARASEARSIVQATVQRFNIVKMYWSDVEKEDEREEYKLFWEHFISADLTAPSNIYDSKLDHFLLQPTATPKPQRLIVRGAETANYLQWK